MQHYFEGEKRRKILEASDKLVDPFRSVVNIAMQRVREGNIDSSNRQRVMLSDDVNNIAYKITDFSVEEYLGVVKSIGDLSLGLFIDVLQLNKAENLFMRLNSMQLPRKSDEVNKGNLYWQRGSKPKDVKTLAVALSFARKL